MKYTKQQLEKAIEALRAAHDMIESNSAPYLVSGADRLCAVMAHWALLKIGERDSAGAIEIVRRAIAPYRSFSTWMYANNLEHRFKPTEINTLRLQWIRRLVVDIENQVSSAQPE